MTWKELKDFCKELTEEQLEKKVIIWREEEVISNLQAETLEEDYYIAKTGLYDEGCFDETTALDLIKDNPKDYPNGINDFKKVYDKGFPVLSEDF